MKLCVWTRKNNLSHLKTQKKQGNGPKGSAQGNQWQKSYQSDWRSWALHQVGKMEHTLEENAGRSLRQGSTVKQDSNVTHLSSTTNDKLATISKLGARQ